MDKTLFYHSVINKMSYDVYKKKKIIAKNTSQKIKKINIQNTLVVLTLYFLYLQQKIFILRKLIKKSPCKKIVFLKTYINSFYKKLHNS